MMDKVPVKTKILRLIFLASLILPALLMSANLVYDEFWTLLNFVPLGIGQILTDLSLPNNHPLNTLLMKLLLPLSDSAVILRLPSLIAGGFIPVLCGMLAWKWSKSNHLTALVSAAVLAMLSMPLVFFSGLARGYALQQSSLLLCIWGLSLVGEDPKKAAWVSVTGALGTIFSVPNGALFVFTAGVGFLVLADKKSRMSKEMWLGAGVIALAAGVFYGINFSALRSAQVWGVEIRDFAGFREFFCKTMLALAVVPSALATIPCWINPPRKRLIVIGLLFLPVVLAVFTNGGPERCYLYFSAALAVAGGIGLGELSEFLPEKRRIPAALVLSLILGGTSFVLQFDFWHEPDQVELFAETIRKETLQTFPVYRASAGFPIRCGTPERKLLEFNRRIFSGAVAQIACFECREGEFNGLDLNGSEKVLPTGLRGRKSESGGVVFWKYELCRAEKIDSGGVYLLILRRKELRLRELAGFGSMLYLNPWLTLNGETVLFQCDKNPGNLPEDVEIYRIGR